MLFSLIVSLRRKRKIAPKQSVVGLRRRPVLHLFSNEVIDQVAVHFLNGICIQAFAFGPVATGCQHRLKRSGARTEVAEVLNFEAASTY